MTELNEEEWGHPTPHKEHTSQTPPGHYPHRKPPTQNMYWDYTSLDVCLSEYSNVFRFIDLVLAMLQSKQWPKKTQKTRKSLIRAHTSAKQAKFVLF